MNNPSLLDWGTATVDFYSEERATALHIISAALTNTSIAARVIKYCRGRLKWCSLQLPKGTRQVFVFDVRGQQLSEDVRVQLLVFGHECPIQIKDK
jgi:hypothetical protein